LVVSRERNNSFSSEKLQEGADAGSDVGGSPSLLTSHITLARRWSGRESGRPEHRCAYKVNGWNVAPGSPRTPGNTEPTAFDRTTRCPLLWRREGKRKRLALFSCSALVLSEARETGGGEKRDTAWYGKQVST